MILKSSHKFINKNFILDIFFIIVITMPIIFLCFFSMNLIPMCIGILILITDILAIKYLINNYYNISNIYNYNECSKIEFDKNINFYTFNSSFSSYDYLDVDNLNITIETTYFGCRTPSAGGAYHNGIKKITIKFYLKDNSYYFIEFMEPMLNNYLIILDKIIKKLKNHTNISYNIEGTDDNNKIANYIDNSLRM